MAPPDYQQSDVVRIMYVHVPTAWLSLMTYSWMAGAHAAATACATLMRQMSPMAAAPAIQL